MFLSKWQYSAFYDYKYAVNLKLGTSVPNWQPISICDVNFQFR